VVRAGVAVAGHAAQLGAKLMRAVRAIALPLYVVGVFAGLAIYAVACAWREYRLQKEAMAATSTYRADLAYLRAVAAERARAPRQWGPN
jgi:hypothetical protein